MVTAALAQLPAGLRRGRSVLVRTDSGGGTHAFLDWAHRRRLSYSVGFTLPDHTARRWEPKRLRHRLFTIAGRIARHARRTVLHLPAHHRWAELAVQALTTLRTLPDPG